MPGIDFPTNRNKFPMLEALKNIYIYMRQEITKIIERLVMEIILNVSFASKNMYLANKRV